MKKIGIMTTGGDCSGLNTAINRIITGANARGWRAIGIRDGTDGLSGRALDVIELNANTLPVDVARLSGSFLGNGHSGAETFTRAAAKNDLARFNAHLGKSLATLKLDALILIGGNGSLSLAHTYREIYSGQQLVCIPKTIDMDIPQTDRTIGFETAVQQLVGFCDQLLLTARSHHRWFVVQAMGRDSGALALNAGVALGADAILIPEIKFDMKSLIARIKSAPRDYGIIMVSEGVKIRGHSGEPADMVSRQLTAAGIPNRPAFPEHTQRAGDTVASDRILTARFADAALNAIENSETYVMTALKDGIVKTIPLADFFNSGDIVYDTKIPSLVVSNAYVSPNDPLLQIAENMNVYVGETKSPSLAKGWRAPTEN